MEVLRTFLHISDLHIGRIDPSTGSSINSAAALRFPWLDGLLGHSYDALCKLEEFYFSIGGEEVGLIVTGDLTSCGAEDEYEAARDYLGADLKANRGHSLGLHATRWTQLAIPGNHDHWPGHPIIGAPLTCLNETFRRTPFIDDPVRLDTGHEIQFLGIDTDADVSPTGHRRIAASGAFLSELKALESDLPPARKHQIRVLLMHHSSCFTHGILCRMASSSRSALYDLMATKAIRLLLCGHTHVPNLKRFPIYHLGKEMMKAVEACCGSTSILTTLPMDTTLLGLRPTRRKWIPNSVIVHTLLAAPNRELHWRMQVFVETAYGFETPTGNPKECSEVVIFPAV